MANPDLLPNALQKPEPHKRVKARRQHGERKLEKAVRRQCVERDGYCLVDASVEILNLGACKGPSEWAHIGRHRRCLTRGMAPEKRHTTAGSAMLCRKHHRDYDAHKFDIRLVTGRGMDGPFVLVAP